MLLAEVRLAVMHVLDRFQFPNDPETIRQVTEAVLDNRLGRVTETMLEIKLGNVGDDSLTLYRKGAPT